MGQQAASDRDTVVAVASLEEFFRDSLDAALAANHVTVDCATSRYVVNLLTLQARADAGEDDPERAGRHRPLALMLADAVGAATREERLFLLQRLGDVALFTAGFFADGLRDRAVGVDYYVGMGEGAYRTLSRDSRNSLRAAAMAEVFAELAAKFLGLVDALNEVRGAASGPDADLLRLYEQYHRTGSPRAARLLHQAGVVPVLPGARLREH